MTNFTIAQAVMARSRPQELAARARSTLAGKIELWLAAAFVFLVPVNILRFDAFYFTASDAIALATLAAMVINRSFPVSPMGATTLLWNSGVLIFWSAMLASSLVYGDPTRGVIVSGQYLFAYLLLTYIILARPWNETVLLIKAFVVSTALMCIHGLVAIPILDQRHSSFVSGNGRFLGWVERENECAALIALALPLALWLVASGSARPRWVWICLPLFTAGVALTGSNTGLLGLIFAISMFVVAMGSWRKIIGASSALVASFLIVVTWGRDFLPAVFQERVLGALESGDIDQAGTFAGRLDLIRESIVKADETGVLGFGADQYRQISDLHAPVHNIYLLIWVEAGLIGMVGFVLILVAALTTGVLALRVKGFGISGSCTITVTLLYASLGNALPHMYGRFFVVPLILAIAPSVAVLHGRFAPVIAHPRRKARKHRPIAPILARPTTRTAPTTDTARPGARPQAIP